jgi:glyoxalase family protein
MQSPLKTPVTGIHHVTAMAGDPQANVDFYARVLGLRLVKRTVNFDDPATYHLYYGDETGYPGTILTFFPWGASSLHGRIGAGQVSVTGFAIPAGSMDYWIERLSARGVSFDGPAARFDETVVSFSDPDGIVLELVETGDARHGWSNGDIPPGHAIRGFHQATLLLAAVESTIELITGAMGFRSVGESGNRLRFASGDGAPGTLLDLVAEPDRHRGSIGVGVVHHIAFRAATETDQLALSANVSARGREVTPVIDRQYFRSIYFREPGGVLFEIATDTPGFPVDESVAELGTHLKLPAWLEPNRAQIEAHLPSLTLPASNNPPGR